VTVPVTVSEPARAGAGALDLRRLGQDEKVRHQLANLKGIQVIIIHTNLTGRLHHDHASASDPPGRARRGPLPRPWPPPSPRPAAAATEPEPQ
jgi:hypothetical protein